MKKSSSRPRKSGGGKSVLSFFLGMIMGVVLFVGAIAGTIYAVVATVRVGQLLDTAKVNTDNIFDQDSDITDKTILDIAKMLYGDVPNIGNMTLNELSEKYGVSNKLDGIDNIEGIDISSIFDMPIKDIPTGFKDIILGVTLNNVGNITGLDFAGYGIPILTDNLNVPIVDAIDAILDAIGGEMTLRQIEDNFGITLGEGGIFDTIKDTPLSQLSDVIDGLQVGAIVDMDTDKFVVIGENKVYVKTDRYEVVSPEDYDSINEDAVSYICGIDENNILLERELRFVQKESVDEEGNKYFVTDENGNPVYVVDNSCYNEEAPDKVYYRYFEYEEYNPSTMPATGAFYVKTFGNHFVDKGFGYELVENGFMLLQDLWQDAEGSPFTTSSGLVDLQHDIYYLVDDEVVKAEAYGVDPFIHTIDKSTLLVKEFDGYARVHVGTADSAIQVLSYLTVGNLQNATDELDSIKLGDVIEINEDSAHILQVMKNTCLKDLSMSIDDLLLSEVIDIIPSLYTEDPNGDYVFVTLPTDKYVEYDTAIHGDKDRYILQYEEDEDGKYVFKGGAYFYYDEDDTALEGLTRYSRRFYLADGTEDADTTYYAHSSGGFYTLYHPKYGTDVKRYTKQTAPEEYGQFRDFILATESDINNGAVTKFYFDGTNMVEGVVDGKPSYIVGNASSKVIQRLASSTIGDLADSFDSLILGDVIDVDPDIYEITYDTSDLNKKYFYEVDGIFKEATQEFIASNSNFTYYTVSEKGTSHIIMRMMAFMPVLEIGNRMEEIIDELYLEDLINIYEFNVIEENIAQYGESGIYFAPFDADYNTYVGEDTYHYTFIPNADGKYYLRDYQYFLLSSDQANAFGAGSTVSFTYSALTVSDIASATTALATIGTTANGYFKDEQGVYHHNPALCSYILTRFIKDGNTEGLGSIYTRVAGTEYSAPVYMHYEYNGSGMLYVNILGTYVLYDSSNLVHADLDKYILLTDGYALVDGAVNDERTHYFYNPTTGTFSTDSTGTLNLTFVKNSVKATEGGVELYYYVALDGKYTEDLKNGIAHTTYTKQLAETTYLRTDEYSATHVFVDGHIYAIDEMPDDATAPIYVKEVIGAIFNIANESEVDAVLALMDANTIKVDYIQTQSVAALRAFARNDVKVGNLNTALEEFTVSDMITIEPDGIFDDSEIKFAKLNDLSGVFQSKLKNMTISNILEWGNITTLNEDVLSIIGEATLEDFFAALSWENGDIHVDIVILYINIYERQNQMD